MRCQNQNDPGDTPGYQHNAKVRIKVVDFGNDPQVAIVVPVADTEDDLTRRCVDHLQSIVRIPFSLILAESRGPQFSYGRSMNAGIQTGSNYEFVIGMDSDAFPYPGATEEILAYIKSRPQLGYVGAKIVGPGGGLANIGWVHQNLLWYVINSLRNRAPISCARRILMGKWWSFGVRAPLRYVPERMVGFLTTFFVIRSKCYSDVGPFDENFRYSFVDVDYSFRVLISRWHVSTCPSAVVLHTGHSTVTRRLRKEEFESWDYYLNKWTRSRMKEVHHAARSGKFAIPDGLRRCDAHVGYVKT